METLSKIEKSLVENHKRLNEIEYEFRENYSPEYADNWEHESIEIKKENELFEIKRKHKLERRNGLGAKIIWLVVGSFIGLFFTMISKYLLKIFEL